MSETSELHEGRWRPAVPLPYFGLLHICCECGAQFWDLTSPRRLDTNSKGFRRYERHYRAVHIEGRPYLEGGAR